MQNNPTSCIVPVRPTNTNFDNDISIIILTTNICHGMKSYGPKTLLSINSNETILEYQIKLIKQVFPKSDIILVVGFLADKIIKKIPSGIRIVENQLFETTNETEQLRLALNCNIKNNTIILKDNIVFNIDTLQEIPVKSSCIIYDSQNKIDKTDVGVTVVDNCATTFSYDIPTKWAHMIYLTGKDLLIVKNLCNNKSYSKMYIFEILNMLLNKVHKIKAIEPKNMEITKIDNSKDLDKIRGYYENINC